MIEVKGEESGRAANIFVLVLSVSSVVGSATFIDKRVNSETLIITGVVTKKNTAINIVTGNL